MPRPPTAQIDPMDLLGENKRDLPFFMTLFFVFYEFTSELPSSLWTRRIKKKVVNKGGLPLFRSHGSVGLIYIVRGPRWPFYGAPTTFPSVWPLPPIPSLLLSVSLFIFSCRGGWIPGGLDCPPVAFVGHRLPSPSLPPLPCCLSSPSLRFYWHSELNAQTTPVGHVYALACPKLPGSGRFSISWLDFFILITFLTLIMHWDACC